MKIGICFGGYCPLHQGHLDLIMTAKKENDKCFVVVCGYDGEKRGEYYGLPLKRRYSLVKETFKNDEQVSVIMINDTKLGIDESMSESNWDIWLKAVAKAIALYDITMFDYTCNHSFTFYVAEQSYKDAIDKRSNSKYIPIATMCQNCILLPKTNNVSGTLIRSNPIKYWNKIALPFRKYFSTNILITGTASEGKSTLTRDIATYFGLPFSEEYGRTYMEQRCMTDVDLTINDFQEFLIEQRRDIKSKIGSLINNGIVISDTDNLVTLMYAQAYSEDENIDLSNEDYKALESIALNLQRGVTWNKIFLFPPKNTFVDDGARYMEQASIEERIKNYEKLIKLLERFGLYDKVQILSGTYLENFNTVKQYIYGLIEQN